MTLTLTCKGCHKVISAATEEEMVAALQAHIVEDHNSSHSPTREQILARLHTPGLRNRLTPREPDSDPR